MGCVREATVLEQLILVIEDDADVRDALVFGLEHEGYDVIAATNGRRGLQLLRHGVVPHAIILDLMMPVMDGWEFRRHQLANPVFASIPVIVLSADPAASRLEGSPGVREVLSKPLDFGTL